MFLRCNNIRCRAEVQKVAMITFCSHIFCGICFSKIKKSKACIACKNYCDVSDFVIKEFDKKPCLAGYSPEDIFEATRKAISFWMYQIEQEYIIQKTLKERIEEECFKAKAELKAARATYNMDIESKTQKIQRLSSALDKERQSNFELTNIISEKNKEHQKLSTLYDKRKTSLQRVNLEDLENLNEE